MHPTERTELLKHISVQWYNKKDESPNKGAPMSNTLLQKHWYDGWFYARFIDAENNPLRDRVLGFIEPGSAAIDLGCGSGGFTLKLAGHCREVVGVDVSGKMIAAARKRLAKSGLGNVSFLHLHAGGLSEALPRRFDYAVLSLMLHETPPAERLQILGEARRAAGRIVILDYQTPQPRSAWGAGVGIVEFLAGREHYRNFRDFVRRGGLPALLQEAGLRIIQEKINRTGVFRLVLAA